MSEDNNLVYLPITPTWEMVRETLAQASAKLSATEMQILLHLGSQLYVEQVRVFSEVEANIVESLHYENKKQGLRLPKEKQEEMTREMYSQAFERTMRAFVPEGR